jgi:YD repeat-containing protein
MKTIVIALAATCALLPPAAQAQQTPPRPHYYIGEGEVELWAGTYMYTNTDISIGGPESEGGLTYTRYARVRSWGPAGGSTGHNLEVMIIRDRYKEDGMGQGIYNYRYYVVLGRSVKQFEQNWGNSAILGGSDIYGTLTKSGADGPYVFTGPDGTVINFDAISLSLCDMGNCTAPASTITQPNGLVTQFAYDATTKKLRLATTNRGFGIGLEYNTDGKVTRACAVNVAQTYASVTTPCPSGTPSATYAYGADPVTYVKWSTFTDPGGQTTTYTYSGEGSIASIKGPGSTVNDLTVGYHPTSWRVASLTYADGTSLTYTYQQTEYDDGSGGEMSNEWTNVTSPLGNLTQHIFAYGQIPYPGSIIDPLNRTTQLRYTWTSAAILLAKKTEPEGNYVEYTRNSRGNVTETRHVSKSGPGPSDIVSTATYPTSCTNLVICDRPLSSTDARGHTTDFTYDSTHGGVLTVTGPAVGGIRPQKRFAYVQRHAWIKTSGGSYAQAGTPVWLLSEERSCRTTATVGGACSGGSADEVVVAYDYGPASGPNNLLLRGKVVTADGVSLRSCYGYDAQGNRISETSPRAGLTVCS